tara:strand:- start:70 stop:633 length:564 start_codon:yes stop_codon:yes gene_type:complete
MANFIFDAFKRLMVEQDANNLYHLETDASGQVALLTSDKIGVVLTTGACTVATCAHHANLAALIADSGSAFVEVSDSISGYSTGGKVVSNCTWENSSGAGYTNAGSFAYLTGDNVTWTALAASTAIKGAVLYYCSTGTLGDDADDYTIAYFDFIAQPDASNLVLQWGSVAGATSGVSGDKGVILKIG